LAEAGLQTSQQECSRLSALIEATKGASNDDESAQKLIDAETRIAVLEAELQSKEAVTKDLVNAHYALEKECKAKSESIAELELELSSAQKTVEETESVGDELETRIRELEEQIASSSSSTGQQQPPDYSSKLDSMQNEIAASYSEATRLTKLVDELQSMLGTKDASICSMQSGLSDKEELVQRQEVELTRYDAIVPTIMMSC